MFREPKLELHGSAAAEAASAALATLQPVAASECRVPGFGGEDVTRSDTAGDAQNAKRLDLSHYNFMTIQMYSIVCVSDTSSSFLIAGMFVQKHL